jgi:hypothetical protein
MTQTEMVKKQRRKLQELIKQILDADDDERLNRYRAAIAGYSTLLGYLKLEQGLDIDRRIEALEARLSLEAAPKNDLEKLSTDELHTLAAIIAKT